MLWDPMEPGMPGFPVHHQLLELAQTHVHRVSDAIHLILCHHLFLLPSICPQIKLFSSEWALCIMWSKYWRFGFRIQSFQDIFRTEFPYDWLVWSPWNLKSLCQHHSSKASILQCSAFFKVQLSHPHMTTGKTIALTRWTCVGKVMSVLFNMLSRLVIVFLSRSRHL